MSFSEFHKIMVNKVAFAGFRGDDRPNRPPGTTPAFMLIESPDIPMKTNMFLTRAKSHWQQSSAVPSSPLFACVIGLARWRTNNPGSHFDTFMNSMIWPSHSVKANIGLLSVLMFVTSTNGTSPLSKTLPSLESIFLLAKYSLLSLAS